MIRPDIVVYDGMDNPVLAVEVKNQHGTDTEWAAQTRRNLLIHGLLPRVRYFLLALPDRFYLWVDKPLPAIENPTYELDPLPYLQPYLDRADLILENLNGANFELLIVSWLIDLVRSGELIGAGNNDWLIESGLLEAIKHGNVALGDPA
jgi:hypothetical protein